jgi:hypothetical protein
MTTDTPTELVEGALYVATVRGTENAPVWRWGDGWWGLQGFMFYPGTDVTDARPAKIVADDES